MFNTPILLLVFNRPEHTKRVLNTLRKVRPMNLYIAADGPRRNNQSDSINCQLVKEILIKWIDWDCEIKTLFRDENLGCGKAVSQSITWFFNHVEDGIILEDDCLPDLSFFKFCEGLLDKYRNVPDVFLISGDNFVNRSINIPWDYYYSSFAHIWGWATWRRVWNKYDFTLSDFSEEKIRIILNSKFDDVEFTNIWISNFRNCKTGKVDTWDYQLQYLLWLADGLSILPKYNLVSNIGFGFDATHTKTISQWSNIKTKKLIVRNPPSNLSIFKEADIFTVKNVFMSEKNNSSLVNNKINSLIIWNKSNMKLSKIKNLPKRVFKKIRSYFISNSSLEYLKTISRYQEGLVRIKNHDIKYADSASFLFIYEEVFVKEIYNFVSSNKTPYIIDAGANIGLATIYFKTLYPEAEIVSFEPDPYIFNILKYNLDSTGISNVTIHQKALWNKAESLQFYSDGADGGRLDKILEDVKVFNVEAISLRNFLNREVDLLKIDIEGAELIVLEDCKDLLGNVARIFVEYHSFTNDKQTLDQILILLKGSGFRYFIQQVGVDSQMPFIKINESMKMDNQLNIFAYR